MGGFGLWGSTRLTTPDVLLHESWWFQFKTILWWAADYTHTHSMGSSCADYYGFSDIQNKTTNPFPNCIWQRSKEIGRRCDLSNQTFSLSEEMKPFAGHSKDTHMQRAHPQSAGDRRWDCWTRPLTPEAQYSRLINGRHWTGGFTVIETKGGKNPLTPDQCLVYTTAAGSASDHSCDIRWLLDCSG